MFFGTELREYVPMNTPTKAAAHTPNLPTMIMATSVLFKSSKGFSEIIAGDIIVKSPYELRPVSALRFWISEGLTQA